MAMTRMSAPLTSFDEWGSPRRARMVVLALGIIAAVGVVILLPPGFAMGAVIVGFLAAGAWVGLSAIGRQRGVRSAAEAEKRLGLPALGMAQHLSAHTLREVSPDQRTPFGYVQEKPESAFAAVFRHALSFGARPGSTRRQTIAITSAYRAEGATTVALCLARTMASLGRSVVLIDCDLRKRTLTQNLGLPSQHGVWEAIGAPDFHKYVQMDPDSHVKIIPAGADGGPLRELFSKRGFFDLVRALRREYECVILDCPAALSSIDARMIVGGADSVVLVVQHGKTPASAVRNAQRQLNIGSHSRPAGILINKAPKSRDMLQFAAAQNEW